MTLADGMSRRSFLRLGGMGLVGVASAMALPGVVNPGSVPPADAATTGIALGSFTPSLPWSFSETDDFSEMLGSGQEIIHWFQDWVMPFDRGYMDAAVARGGTPLVTWEPWEFGGGVDQPRYALRTIVEGKHDAYVRRWARTAAAWGRPLYLRFAHEMNGDWTSWSPGVNGNTSSQFVAAWRRVHDIFRRAGAANVRWVWSPVAHYEGATPYGRVYPGGAYVDWAGISGYNWGNTRAWSRWQSFSEIFGDSYDKMGAVAPRKPVMIPEVGSAESGGNKADWIRSAFFEEIPGRFPRLKAVVWFQANKENDWRVNSSPDSLEAYRRVQAGARYQGRLY